MGVQNLWQSLESTAKPITLDALEGKRVAVEWTEGSDSREGFSRSPWKKTKRSDEVHEDDLFALPSTSAKINGAK
ncbi:hypothetical protein AAVH_36792 [Aphelenchoides avenae]|nr:hypothetical protein AAVH_36792 [Aphelenchus avenae]